MIIRDPNAGTNAVVIIIVYIITLSLDFKELVIEELGTAIKKIKKLAI